jgi:uncharacterized protein (DUF1015 family)
LACIVPFKATHYNTSRFGKDLRRFVAPPYDVIDRDRERRLKGDRLNIAHLTLGDEGDGYATAGKRLKRWLNDGVLVEDEGPAFYICEQTFQTASGEVVVRTGIVGLVRLEEFSKGTILPHENTIPKHKADRLALMSALRGDMEQIFMLYDDPDGAMEEILQEWRRREEALRFIDDDGVHHRMVRVGDEEACRTISQILGPRKMLIADGHHRYETALEYSRGQAAGDEGGDRPCDYVLAALVSFRNPGLIINPTHRLIKGLDSKLLGALPDELRKRFDVEVCASPDELVEKVEGGPSTSFGLFEPAKGTCLLVKPGGVTGSPLEDLSVHVLQEKVLKEILGYTSEMIDGKVNIEYVKGTAAAIAAMETDEYQACFFVRAPSVEQVMAVCGHGAKMPQKSTYFFPKIWSGTLMYLFER